MKKIFKGLLLVCLCFCLSFTFAGCKPKIKSETTNITTGVVSNGGIVLYYDGYVYFINGTKTVNETNVKAKNICSGIYRAQAYEDGRISYDENGKFSKVERVSSALAGYDDGSIFIFGDYLYFTTPCDSRDRDGTMLFGKTEFRRIDLKNKFAEQVLYTTATSDDTINYTYYKQGDSLNLVVYEQNNATLTSLKIGKKVTTNFVKTEVKSAVLSKNFGEPYATNCQTDTYIYYTLSYDSDSAILKGSRVYMISPNGENEKKISEGHTLTLLSIEYDYLVYYEEEYGVRTTYAEKITKDTESLSFAEKDTISQGTYDVFTYFLENGKLKLLVFSGAWIASVEYNNGTLGKDDLHQIVDFYEDEKISIIALWGDYVIYQLTTASSTTGSNAGAQNLIYKVKYKNIGPDEENKSINLSTTKPEVANGTLVPEIYNGYLYFFHKDSESNTVYLKRMDLITPAEKGEKDEDGVLKEVGEAELIGVEE